MAQDWASDVRKYVPDADDGIIAGIVRYCGIALQKRDSSLVSFSDAKETDRVRNNFLKKKLALTQADDVLDAAIAAVGARMKEDRSKNRVTVYYLLAEHFDMLQLFQKKGSAKLAPVVEAIEADDADSTTEGVASLASLGSGAKKKAKAMVDTGIDKGSEVVAGAGKKASKAGAAVVGAAGAAVAGVAGAAGKVANLAGDTLSGAADTASKAGSAVAGAAGVAASGAADVAGKAGAVVAGAAGAAVSGVTDVAGKAAGMAGDAMSGAADLAGKAADVAGDAISDVADAAGKAGVAVAGAAGAAVAGAAGAASLVGDKLSSAASGAMHGLKGDDDNGKGGGSLRWLWWLLLLAVLALLIWWLFCRSSGGAAGAGAEASASAMATTETGGSAIPAGAVALASAPAEGSVAIPTGDGVTVESRDGKPVVKVYFSSGKVTVPASLALAATGVKDYLASHAGAALEVSGYADPSGNAQANAAISKQRAEAVKAALVAAGIADTQVALVKPESVTDAAVPAAAARRVEVLVK